MSLETVRICHRYVSSYNTLNLILLHNPSGQDVSRYEEAHFALILLYSLRDSAAVSCAIDRLIQYCETYCKRLCGVVLGQL